LKPAEQQTVDRIEAPIGVFDSGVGGLSVLAALRRELPSEHFIYLGDTARLPYGTKSGDTVVRYALQAAQLLRARQIKALVVACNTASAVALPALRRRLPGLPILGVVEPGAAAAVAASRNGCIAVIGTEGTVRGGAYQRAITTLRPDAVVLAAACQLFVSLAEEGWTEGPIVAASARRYLDPLFASGADLSPDVLVLGCTHFPALAATLQRVVGADVALVDSARTTAAALRVELSRLNLLRTGAGGRLRLCATDGAERFARVGPIFLGEAIDAAAVQLVDLGVAQDSSE